MDLVGIRVPCREALNIDDHSATSAIAPRYARVGYQGPATQSVRLADEAAPERVLTMGECD